jgi:hypothetical protein
MAQIWPQRTMCLLWNKDLRSAPSKGFYQLEKSPKPAFGCAFTFFTGTALAHISSLASAAGAAAAGAAAALSFPPFASPMTASPPSTPLLPFGSAGAGSVAMYLPMPAL